MVRHGPVNGWGGEARDGTASGSGGRRRSNGGNGDEGLDRSRAHRLMSRPSTARGVERDGGPAHGVCGGHVVGSAGAEPVPRYSPMPVEIKTGLAATTVSPDADRAASAVAPWPGGRHP